MSSLFQNTRDLEGLCAVAENYLKKKLTKMILMKKRPLTELQYNAMLVAVHKLCQAPKGVDAAGGWKQPKIKYT